MDIVTKVVHADTQRAEAKVRVTREEEAVRGRQTLEPAGEVKEVSVDGLHQTCPPNSNSRLVAYAPVCLPFRSRSAAHSFN